jgi:hypothetical protein
VYCPRLRRRRGKEARAVSSRSSPPQRLSDAGSFPVEHVTGRLRRHVPRSEAGSSRCQDESGIRGERSDRGGDRLALVGNDPALDLVALGPQELVERVSAAVLARTCHDAVRHRQHSRLQLTRSFVFSTSRTSAIRISLSTAFAMS